MRSILCILFFSCLSFTNLAQTEKGRMMLGGQVNYYQNENRQEDKNGNQKNETEYTSLLLGIRGGYFIYNDVAFGLLVNFNSTTNTDLRTNSMFGQDVKRNSTGKMLLPGVFARYYKPLGKSNFRFFVQLDILYGSGSSESTAENISNGTVINEQKSNTTEKQVQIVVNPGISYFITRSVAIETYFGNFGYSTSRSKIFVDGNLEQESSSSGFNTGLNLSNIYFGLNFYFGQNKE